MSHDCKQPVCQLRLDLLDFRLGPPSAGDCNDDQVRVHKATREEGSGFWVNSDLLVIFI